MNKKGLFFVFEGGEGGGKSTVQKWLAESLIAAGYNVLSLREPGATALGEAIRSLIMSLTPKEQSASPLTELFLFQAARAELVPRIKEALKRGKIVLLDRFTPSTVAYQGHGKEMDLGLIEQTSQLATGGLKPNLTLLFDIPPKVSLERARARGQLDRFEREGLAFHHRVRQGYLTQAQKNENSGKWVVIDATLPLETVQEQALKSLQKLLDERK